MLRFDPGAMTRGVAYFHDGYVGPVEIDGSLIVAEVYGTRPRPYTAFLDADGLDGSCCTCPVGTRCKHIVAVVCTVLAGDLDHPRLEAAVREGIEPEQLARLEEEVFSSQSEREGWRLAFLIETGDDPAYRVNGWRPLIYLARQYLRKDGSHGRVEQIPRGQQVYAPCPEAAELAAHLDLVGGVAPAVALASQLERPGAPIFVGIRNNVSGAQDRRVRICRLKKLDILVKPVAPGAGYGKISLAMEVRVNQEHSIDPHTSVTFDCGLGYSLLFDPSGLLLIGAEDGPLAGLAAVRGPHGVFSFSQAYRLGSLRRLAEQFPDAVTVSQPRSVRVVVVDPEPTFLISHGHGDYQRDRYYLMVKAAREAEDEPPPDGFYDGEYRIHEMHDDISHHVIKETGRIVRTRATYDGHLDVWVWEIPEHPPADSDYPEPLRTGVALLETGYPVYMEHLDGSRVKLKKPERLSVTVRSGLDWFKLSVSRRDGTTIDPELLQQLAREQGIRDGRILVPLEPEDIERLREILELTEASEEGHIPVFDLAALAQACELADEVDPELSRLRALAEELLGSGAQGPPPEEVELPAGLQAQLRPYQREGFAWLCTLAKHGLSGCLADDMGLGKTVQALTLMLHLREAGGAAPADSAAPGGFLVIAPVSTLSNWEREAKRFAPALSVVVHHGPDRTVDIDLLAASDLVVTSYATALRDAETLEAIEWRLVCLDEAQFIKNPYARTTGSVKRLTADLRLSLTGTPVENVSTDLWSIMDFLNPGVFGTQTEFNKRFPKRGNADSETTARRFARLRRMVAPFVLRRTKEAVAPELPPRTETVMACEMGPEQGCFYETLRAHHYQHVREAIDSGEGPLIGAAIFTALLRLRQAAIYPENADERGAGIPSAKEAKLLSQLTEVAAEGHNALVFSQFVSALKRLRAAAEAGGTGINLTAADYVYICDPWWNPQVERQVVDRAHRIGRERPVVVTRLVTAGTIEEKVLELQDQKRRLATDIITENESGLADASPEELLALFE